MATDVESKGKENRASVSLALIRNVLDGRAKVEALSAALGRDGQGAMSLGEAAVCELLLQVRGAWSPVVPPVFWCLASNQPPARSEPGR